MESTVIFGAGVSGLSAAHYLAQRGHKVIVIEKLDQAGGMARSKRVEGNLPSEYSWRAWGPFYSNVYDIMNDIPFKGSTVLDQGFSGERLRPKLVDDDMKLLNNGKLPGGGWRASFIDKIKLGWLFLNGWCSSEKRNNEVYANEYSYLKLTKYLTLLGGHTFSMTDGPFTGSDYGRLTSHHLYAFYKKTFFAQCAYEYKNGRLSKCKEGKKASNKKKWITLQGPSNEYFFDPWVEYLKSLGVEFRFGESLSEINYSPQDEKILSMRVDDGKEIYDITADNYVLAINPFALAEIIRKEPILYRKDLQLANLCKIARQEEHRQISFRIAFKDKIHFQNRNDFIVLTDSEYCITFYSCDNMWSSDVHLGDNVQSLWSGTATVDICNGKLHNMPMKYLTKEQFTEEIKHQIYRSATLNEMIKRDNNGKDLKDFEVLTFEIWPEWEFADNSYVFQTIKGNQPKWVNTIKTRKIQPKTRTCIPGLYLAGAHCDTSADLWCMEAAAESGREVADHISRIRSVYKYEEPGCFKPFKAIDECLYNWGLPNVVVCIWVLVIIGLIIIYYYTKSLIVLGLFAIMFILTICLVIKEPWYYKIPKAWDRFSAIEN